MPTSPIPAFQPALPGAVDAFGCSADKLQADQSLTSGSIQFHRKSSRQASGQIAMAAAERGFVAGIALRAGHRRRILRGSQARSLEFAVGDVYVRDLAEDYKADYHTSFDFILMEVPRSLIERTSGEMGRTRLRALRETTSAPDPVLAHLRSEEHTSELQSH